MDWPEEFASKIGAEILSVSDEEIDRVLGAAEDTEGNVYVFDPDREEGDRFIVVKGTGPDLEEGEQRQGVAKAGAVIPGLSSGTTAQIPGFSATEITPEIHPRQAVEYIRTSAHLRPIIDAYSTNIDSFGHTYTPLISLDEEDDGATKEAIRAALEFDAWFEMEDGVEDGDPGSAFAVTDDQVADKLESIRTQMRYERAYLDYFFAGFSLQGSFVDMRRRTRDDLESTGNAYWEILRSDVESSPDDPVMGRILHGLHIPSVRIKMVEGSTEEVMGYRYVRKSIISVGKQPVRRQFAKYCEKYGAQSTRYYKEFGDPRVMDPQTGEYYPPGTILGKESGQTFPPGTDVPKDKRRAPATEIYHHRIYTGGDSPYGKPRWLPSLLSILGSRAADQVNLDYFHAKPPAGILMVNGGKLTKQAVQKIEATWNNRARGKDKFHGLVIIEAVDPKQMPGQAGAKMGLQFMPLTETQSGDALFQHYDERNGDKIAMTMRVPRLLRGSVTETNRATAETALLVAEQQVFRAERVAFDHLINNEIFPQISRNGVVLWSFKSLGPDPIDIELADIVVRARKDTDILTREEARQLLGAALNFDLPSGVKSDAEPG